MEALAILILLYLAIALIVFPIWAFIKIRGQAENLENVQYELQRLQEELREQRTRTTAVPPAPAPIPPIAAAAAPAPVVRELPRPIPSIAPTPTPEPARPAAAIPVTPSPAQPSADLPPALPPVLKAATAGSPTPPTGAASPTPPVYQPPEPVSSGINWEQFMGAKLFAWLGGLALLLGVAFFIKYAFDHNWFPPELRVAAGFVLGVGLIIAGIRLVTKGYTTPAQTLVGAGIVSLYIVTFACNSIYKFSFFGPIPTFLLMTLITAAAFVLAVRLDGQVIAVLGMLGGFLTPILLSTGRDNPPGLFGYLALLDIGLIAVALRTPWSYLVPVSAMGTIVMMVGWANKFFTAEKGPTAMIVTIAFAVLYMVAAQVARRREGEWRHFTLTAALLLANAFAFGLFFLEYRDLASRAGLYLGYILLIDVLVLRLAWQDEEMPKLHLAGGMVVFALLAIWTGRHLSNDLLPWALVAYLLFAALHTAFPLWLEKQRPASSPSWWSQVVPPISLLLLLLPIVRLDEVSFLIWPAILLIDALAIGLALMSASLLSVGAVLVLTLLAAAVCIFKVPAGLAFPTSLLLLIGGFAIFFVAAAMWLLRKLGARLPEQAGGPMDSVLGDARAQLPVMSSLLPFILLVMACARLAVPDPSMVFGLGLLLVVLTLGLSVIMRVEWLALCALVGIAGVEYTWHARHFDPGAATLPLFWYLGFYAIFAAFPFAFHRVLVRLTGPWAVAALAGVVQFPLVYRLVAAASPNDVMGLLPAMFTIVPMLSLVAILRTVPADNPARLNQLAWFGGVALLFITLIFPIQFDRQWLTVAWALEGVALLWLFHRVPHPGLRGVGVALLITAFARLALNPAVFAYHARGDVPLLNWYLYAYGTVIVCLFVAARLMAPPREILLGTNVPPLLRGLGVVLAFLLLNIEIADFFTLPGERALAFSFSGNFARDMTYTIAWALFAFGLLGAGIWQRQKVARYAGIVLLSVALLKLFFRDMAHLEALYRIGAFFGVAAIAIAASFAYQRFLPAHEKTPPR